MFKRLLPSLFALALSVQGALAQGAVQSPNLFWSTPLSGTGNLGLRAIGLADISGLLAFSNLTGSAICSQLPALTGDVTTSAGSCATTLATVPVNKGGTGATTLSSGLPLFGNGTSAISTGTISGNTTKLATTTGALTNTHCVQIDASGNFVDAGGACTTGGGGGTVVSGTINQLAYYASAGTAVSGETLLQAVNFPALTGDITTASGALATTLATVNSNVGSFGGTNAIPNITVNGKGLITAAGTNTPAIPFTELTGSATCAQLPALTGAVTSSAGSCATAQSLVTVPNGGTGDTTFSANLPLIGNVAGAIAQGTRSGNTTVFGTTSGTLTVGDCVSIGAGGNLIDAGGACTTGGGGGTVNSGTINQLAYYASAGTAVSGETVLQAVNFPALTGDVTTVSGALASTLATVNANTGSFGSSTSIPNFTVNGKGLITAAGSNVVIAPAGTLSGSTLAAGVTASSLTSLGTLTTLGLSGAITDTQAIAATSTDGLLLDNATPATVGAQKWSPRVHWSGMGWKTNATAGSQSVDVIEELQPVQGAASPSGNLVWSASINGGAYGVLATLPTGGGFNLNSGNYQIGGSQIAFSNIAGSESCGQTSALTGDVTTSAGSCATLLTTVNSNVGSFGSTTLIPAITVNAKGQVTAVTTNTPAIPVSDITGTLPVASGGTGDTTMTANLPLIGNGTSAVAQGTRSGNTTAFVTLSGSPTNGDFAKFDANGNVTAAGGTTVAGSTSLSTVSAPTGTSSTSGVMMGLAGSITPSNTGNVLFTINGSMSSNAGGNDFCKVSLREGTGVVPTNGAALTGTALGLSAILSYPATSAGFFSPFSVTGVATGLALGTAVWIDTGVAAVVGGTCTIQNVTISAMEQ